LRDFDIRKIAASQNPHVVAQLNPFGAVIAVAHSVTQKEFPEVALVLGSGSCRVAVIVIKGIMIPFFHIETHNRSFPKRGPGKSGNWMVYCIRDIILVVEVSVRQFRTNPGPFRSVREHVNPTVCQKK